MTALLTRLTLAVVGAGLGLALAGCGSAATSTVDTPASEASASVDVSDSPIAVPGSARSSVGTPQSLEIETIGVNAPVIEVGTAADGSQEVPTSMHEVGWWEPGSEPATAGSSVLVGHTYAQGNGVFDDLEDLSAGDIIGVTGSEGTADFVVEKVESVPVEDFADVAAEIYRSTGDPALVVMTCGDFDGDDYRATMVVYAALLA